MVYFIYTDGSCRNNGQKNSAGAYGFILLNESQTKVIYSEAHLVANTTNQRMELMAALSACQKLNQLVKPFDEVRIFTDSAYLCNCIKQGWYKKWLMNNWVNSKKEPVANKDLWVELIPFFDSPNYIFQKVEAHTTNIWNNYVDNIVQNTTARYLNGSSS